MHVVDLYLIITNKQINTHVILSYLNI